MSYELHDEPGAQDAGEFVRLALEAAGVPYLDVARGPEAAGQGPARVRQLLNDPRQPQPPFALPFVRDGEHVIGQVAAILHHLAPALKLVSRSERLQAWTQQIQLTLADMVAELQALQPATGSAADEALRLAEARRRASDYGATRLPQCLRWFEQIIVRNPAGPRHLVAGKLSYADLSLFQFVEGLQHAFPRATSQALASTPALRQLHARVAALPRVAAYLRSERRLPFDPQGPFRHHPDQDTAAA